MWSPRQMVSGHFIDSRRGALAAVILLAAVLQLGAAVGLAYVAGFGAVRDVLHSFQWPWLAAVVGGLAVSFVGYYFAYRGIYRVDDGPTLSRSQLLPVVTAGFGGFLARGGAAVDDYALQAAGADERESSVRVSALAGMEHGVLALGGCGAAIYVLIAGLTGPPSDFTLPWAIIPIPGFVIAFWAASRYRDRYRGRRGWRGKVGVFLDSIQIVRGLLLRREHAPAFLGMVVFWLADAFAAWAGLRTFGFAMNPGAFVIGYATGMVFTRRTGPLAGAGILMCVLPVTIWYCGAPFAVAVVGIFAYRFLALWGPMIPSLASVPKLRAMGEQPEPYAQGHPRKEGEPALRRGDDSR